MSEENNRLLALLCSRLAHAGRTPLGTAMSVLEDFRSGREISELAAEDASVALDRIEEIFRSMSSFAETLSLSLKEERLSNVLRSELEKGNSKFGNLEFELSLEESTKKRPLDSQALSKAIEYVSEYLLQEEGSSRVSVKLSNSEFAEKLSILFETTSKTLQHDSIDLSTLACEDHSVPALGLFVADTVFTAQGGKSVLKAKQEAAAVLEIVFSD